MESERAMDAQRKQFEVNNNTLHYCSTNQLTFSSVSDCNCDHNSMCGNGKYCLDCQCVARCSCGVERVERKRNFNRIKGGRLVNPVINMKPLCNINMISAFEPHYVG